MPTASNPVEQAFRRCALLARVIELEYARARENPTHPRYADLGITEIGQKRDKATTLALVEEAFDELVALVDHLTILDMAAAFENLFGTRIATAVGAARKTLAERHRRPALAGREGIVRETKSFEGLRDITALIDTDLSQEFKSLLGLVRDNRNAFAHGTDIRNAPTILKEQARDALTEAVGLLRPV